MDIPIGLTSFLYAFLNNKVVNAARNTRMYLWQNGEGRKGVKLRINSSVIGMNSSRNYVSKSQRSFTLSLKQKTMTGNLQDEGKSNKVKGQRNIRTGNQQILSRNISNISSVDDKKAIGQIRDECMQYLMYWLFNGTKNKKVSFQQWKQDNDLAQQQQLSPNLVKSTYEVNLSVLFEEQETTNFSTVGTVRTADGREIGFNLEMTMSRSFRSYYEMAYTKEIVQAVDPLVINLDGNIAQVSDQKFEFDLDGDGILDTISKLNQRSGYLAIDKNGDGKINDGNELFGTKSGDGFYDLSKYDSDGNGWIDEGDEIWDKLLIWTQDANGNDELYHVSKAGVGAICLQKASTDFSLNSIKDNQANGKIRSTGVFLYENGNAGTVQHLDLMK